MKFFQNRNIKNLKLHSLILRCKNSQLNENGFILCNFGSTPRMWGKG
ncbi:hypothetical protein GS511_07880 [Leptospira borgpetersenii]|uniref:Uncharacterized protein n=1 Tax=Leptospira borgpetersenii serovar Ballum TaxID=280505 RepID=A0A0S2IRD2_LEPBO|nr:hypothetical protein LBBP_01933 [Leptospira borgpetersenii serovar Ballum]QHE26909.1 hypothetical protein GS524_07875 [Leptospira borgpetersenii]QHE30210.1 hypothetical protein GS523_07885 [Leptospira borgpetersenii]QHE33517.1 hypothetical protein GS517_07885 [Leptospira borgpetersenii]QHE36749.1 hypothetical protein GS510_07530 [Leptospira borgpetersenii]